MVAHVVTLANSIVGVSVLAMPFCFKYCGVFLATLMLISSAVMTRVVCYFLLKAGVMTKRRSYEMLAYHTFGHGGKFMVEITIIGFLVGTLIAFLVVIGDLGPQIVAEIFSIENNHSLRTVVMTGLALFVALPLGLLRDIDSLGSVSTISFLFYLFLVLKILNEGLASLDPVRIESLNYWRPSGVLQCIPIIAMALSCQTQIFSIYDSLPEPSVQKMNEVVKKAVYLCTSFYFCVGFFGYLAFSTDGITGNILMSFGPSWTTQLIKVCFVLSIAFSVPLCVFPCRASLYSLIFRGTHMHHSLHDISTNYIPDGKLRLLTVLIVGSTLIIALLIPNIELVLGLVGSTAGSVICLIFPSAMFIRVTPKKTTERLLAQALLAAGICIMVLTTYVTLYAVEQSHVKPPEVKKDARISAADEVILGPGKDAVHAPPPPALFNEDEIVKIDAKREPPPPPIVKDPQPPLVAEPVKEAVPPPPAVVQPKENIPVPAHKYPEDKLLDSSVDGHGPDPIASKLESQKYVPPESPVVEPQRVDNVPGNTEIKQSDVEPKVLKQEAHVAAEKESEVVEKPAEDEHKLSKVPIVEDVGHVEGKTAEKKSDVVGKESKVGDAEHLPPAVPAPPQNVVAEENLNDKKTKEFLAQLDKHQKEQERLIVAQQKILDQLEKHQKEDAHAQGGDEHAAAESKKILEKMHEATDIEKKNGEILGKVISDLGESKKNETNETNDKKDKAVEKENANESPQAHDPEVHKTLEGVGVADPNSHPNSVEPKASDFKVPPPPEVARDPHEVKEENHLKSNNEMK